MTKQNCTSNNPSKQVVRKNQKYTLEGFVARAKVRHGDAYNYDRSVCVRGHDKIEILCNGCNNYFTQRASAHLYGQGCKACKVELSGFKQRSNTLDFIGKAVIVHGEGRYNYDKTCYVRSYDDVVITCPLHGDFNQMPSNHLKGRGCYNCGVEANRISSSNTIDNFFRQVKGVHSKGAYSYDKSVYVRAKDPMIITCSIHGDFLQSPYNHVKGAGCHKCAYMFCGYSRSDFVALCDNKNEGFGYIYVLKCSNDSELFYKVGRTSTSVRTRFTQGKMPYDYEVLYYISESASFIFDIEIRLHSLLKGNHYTPKIGFGGQTECFTTIKPIEKLLKELSTTEQLQLLA